MAIDDGRNAAHPDAGRLGRELVFRLHSGFGLRFAPDVECEFERATATSRRRTIYRIGLLQLVFVELAILGFYLLVDHVALVALYAGVLNLYSLALHLTLRTRPRAFIREASIMLSVPLWVLMAQIMALAANDSAGFWAIQVPIALQPFLLATAIQSRFPFCVFGCVAIILLVIGGTAVFSDMSVSAQLWLGLIQCVAITYSLFAAWKLEARERGYFLSMRRETVRSLQLDAANVQLAELSLTDGLTGIANRRGLERFFEHRPAQRGIGVIVIDVDYFKNYNDQYGHPAGDRCLSQIARLLAANVRPAEDQVGRWGGEEFMMILDTDRAEHCKDTAERLCRAVTDLAIPHERSAIAPVVTISAGFAHCSANERMSLATLFRRADEALYAAKESGRNRVGVRASAASDGGRGNVEPALQV